MTGEPPGPSALLSHLDVLHMLKEVRLGVVVVRQLDEVAELFFGGEGLDEAGQHRGVIVLHALEGAQKHKLAAGKLEASELTLKLWVTSVLLRSPLSTASRMVCRTTSL